MLSVVRKLITMDIYYSIYDKDCIVQYIYPEDGDKDGIIVGTKFHDVTGKLDETIATGECIHNILPMERFGFVMEGNIIPVYEDGEICGAITTAYVPMNPQQIAARELAVQSIYYLILSIDLKNHYHCNRLYFNYETQQFPTDAQHFDDFCEKSLAYVHPEDVGRFREFTDIARVKAILQQKKSIMMECRLLNRSGEYHWAELIFNRIDEAGNGEGYEQALYMVRDIHERKSKELEILRKNQELIAQLETNNNILFEQGMTDELTKLYNRKGLVWSGTKLLEKAQGAGQFLYTMVADLNGLKYINDKFGHEEGDKAIRAIANQIRATMPESFLVSRSGGDEFIVMAMLEEGSQLPWEIERRFVKNMDDFNHDSGLPYMVVASFGWDFRPAQELGNLDECFMRADKKMYLMKSRKKVPGSFSVRAQSEMSRRFGSEKQRVVIFSADEGVRAEIAGLFDSGYLIIASDDVSEVGEQLSGHDEVVLLFVDNDIPGQSGLEYARKMPEAQRRNAVLILLLDEEDPETVVESFEAGVDDVLFRPYGTVLNKCHMTHLFRMNVANRKLSHMLEQHEILK